MQRPEVLTKFFFEDLHPGDDKKDRRHQINIQKKHEYGVRCWSVVCRTAQMASLRKSGRRCQKDCKIPVRNVLQSMKLSQKWMQSTTSIEPDEIQVYRRSACYEEGAGVPVVSESDIICGEDTCRCWTVPDFESSGLTTKWALCTVAVQLDVKTFDQVDHWAAFRSMRLQGLSPCPWY